MDPEKDGALVWGIASVLPAGHPLRVRIENHFKRTFACLKSDGPRLDDPMITEAQTDEMKVRAVALMVEFAELAREARKHVQ